jgi:phospholipid/cholesterol/gamma-HCH transport system substrate-binding protein
MVAFALSCVGLLLFLWISFGGIAAARPAGLPVQRRVQPGVQLGTQADVEIAGVTDRQGRQRRARPPHRADAGGDPDRPASTRRGRPTPGRSCARRRCSARPTSQLSPATRRDRCCATAAPCRESQVSPTVQLDQILSTFDPKTRGRSRPGCSRGARPSPTAASNSTRRLPSCTRSPPTSTRCWRCCNRDSPPPDAAARRRPGAVGDLELALAAPGLRPQRQPCSRRPRPQRQLAATIQAFPAFLSQTARDDRQAGAFSTQNTKPLVDELHPAAVAAQSGARESVASLAPAGADRLMTNLRPLTHRWPKPVVPAHSAAS